MIKCEFQCVGFLRTNKCTCLDCVFQQMEEQFKSLIVLSHYLEVRKHQY